MKSIKRKILLINRPFQLSILGWFMVLYFIVIGIFYASIGYFFNSFTSAAASAGLPEHHVFFRFMEGQRGVMNVIFIYVSLATLVTTFIGGLYLSHRVAGPLYRLTKYLRENTPDDLGPMKFRENDFFPEVEQAFNEFIKKRGTKGPVELTPAEKLLLDL